MPLLSQAIADQVAHDHLSRQATADDASLHVLYWEAPHVRSMLAADWLAQRGPLPADPTQAESDAAVAAQEAARVQALADAATLRQRVIALAQGTVGLPVDAAFTTAQLRALLAILLWNAAALDTAGAVRPLADWIDRRYP